MEPEETAWSCVRRGSWGLGKHSSSEGGARGARLPRASHTEDLNVGWSYVELGVELDDFCQSLPLENSIILRLG